MVEFYRKSLERGASTVGDTHVRSNPELVRWTISLISVAPPSQDADLDLMHGWQTNKSVPCPSLSSRLYPFRDIIVT